MRSWKTLFSDKRWLLLLGIVAFALAATWFESCVRRGQPEQPNVIAQQRNRDSDGGRGSGRERRPPPPLPEEFTGTTGVVEQLKPDPAPTKTPTLRGIRTGEHDDFDRVVFDFDGDLPPGFHVEYIDKLTRKCGSDELKVLGGTWLLVRMTPAQARLENRLTSVERIQMDEGLKTIKLVRQVCDAEGQVEWLIEVADRKPYRAEPRPDPARLVIDIKHQ